MRSKNRMNHFAKQTTSPNGDEAWRSGLRAVTIYRETTYSIELDHFAKTL
jgi:hypothetical protein